jgi:hypothetical protein
MGAKQRTRLVNFNRVLIFALSLAGLLMDGYQGSDLPFTLALLVWLWLAVFTQMEAKILHRTRRLSTSRRFRDCRQRLPARAQGTSVRRARAGAQTASLSPP